jgi:hypothetical protein
MVRSLVQEENVAFLILNEDAKKLVPIHSIFERLLNSKSYTPVSERKLLGMYFNWENILDSNVFNDFVFDNTP